MRNANDFYRIAKKVEEKFQPDLFDQPVEESKPQKTVIELFDSYGEEGKYDLWFKINDKEYLYRTWSKKIFDDIKQKAKRQPGTALNMAKRDCKEIKLKLK